MKALHLPVCLLLVCSASFNQSEAARRSQRRPHRNGITDRGAFLDFLNSLLGSNGGDNHAADKHLSGQLIRLSGFESHYKGWLEVFVSDRWGYVCDDEWTKVNADVACRQLGFVDGSVGSSSGEKGPAFGGFSMDDVSCSGAEQRLHDCGFKTKHDCRMSEAIKLVCRPNTGCKENEIAGASKCYKFYTKAKDINEARETCNSENRELLQIDSPEENHFLSNVFIAYQSRNIGSFAFTAGTKSKGKWSWGGRDMGTTMWMAVTGQQEPVKKRKNNCLALSNKPADPSAKDLDYFYWRAIPCTPASTISVVCQRSKESNTPAGFSISLVGGKGDHEGNVEVTFEGQKYRVCDDEWDKNDAAVVCRMLGFNGGVPTKHSFFGRDSVPILLDDIDCDGTETDLGQCEGVIGVKKTDCYNWEFAGVKCNKTFVTDATTLPSTTKHAQTTDNERVTVRLVGGLPHSGTVEVTRAGVTGVICDDEWDLNDGHVVCRMLGYKAAQSVTQRNQFDYTMKGDTFLMDDVDCTGEEDNLAQCEHRGTNNCVESEVAGVTCVTDSQEITVRLVGGSGEHEGNVELLVNGSKYRICDDQWDDNDATVICRMLGFTDGGVATSKSQFGRDNIPILLDDVSCSGSEKDIGQCRAIKGENKHDCITGAENAGVVCNVETEESSVEVSPAPSPVSSQVTSAAPTSTSSSIFDIRLVGGNGKHEGNVELIYKGRNYRICDDRWSNSEASVICRMLGFTDGGVATSKSQFGRDKVPIILDEVTCSGLEKDIGQCSAIVGVKKHDCTIGHENAGVICNIDSEETSVLPTSSPGTFVTGQCGQRPFDTDDLFSKLRKRRSSNAIDPAAKLRNLLRIVGGHEAAHGEYPWQARVHRQLSYFYGSHHCGAVIINNHWLLSAAHCFGAEEKLRKKSQYRIVVGDHDTAGEDKGEQTFTIDKLILHKGYNFPRKNDDIALIKIQPNKGRVIEFNHYVQPACLPASSTPHKAGKSCLISGWGSTNNDTNPSPKIMLAAKVPVWSQNLCRRTFRYKITGGYDDGMMCAGYPQGGVDTCSGDSGGPLVCKVQGSYTLFGLTSFGFGCGNPGSPGVYARVAHFLPWIKQTMATHSKTNQEAILPQQ